MKKLYRPIFMDAFKGYAKQQAIKDIATGAIVAIIAFPLSVALAIASGMSPEQGLYTAIIGAVFVALFGGSRVQIGGATAATVMTVFGIIEEFGFVGLAVATIMAGILLIFMGICRVGELLPYIPYSVTLAFTASIGVGIFTGQLKEFFGMDIANLPVKNVARITSYIGHVDSIDITTVLVGCLALAILFIWPKFKIVIPNSLVAIVVTTLLVKLANLQVNTIDSVYGTLPNNFPKMEIPVVSLALMEALLPSALTLAILVAIVSLLSCVVTDGLTQVRHDPNAELIGEGIANVFCGLFGAVPIAGAVARSTVSCKNGGKTPVVSIVHSIVVLLVLLFMMPLVAYIPMVTLSAILIQVAYNMSNPSAIRMILFKAPKTDAIIFLLTISTGVFVDLLTAFSFGFIASAFLFMKRMAEVTRVSGWKYVEDREAFLDKDSSKELLPVPPQTLVYEISGPMFFAVAGTWARIEFKEDTKVIIVRMRSVPALDITSLNSLRVLHEKCKRHNTTMLFSHVLQQPYHVMEKNGFVDEIGEEYFLKNIQFALEKAKEII
ncbi:MAG: SulP family inorganic anion transporter [Lachnospiraceae bacterium]